MGGDDWSSGVHELLKLEDLLSSVGQGVEGVHSSLDVVTVNNIVVSHILCSAGGDVFG